MNCLSNKFSALIINQQGQMEFLTKKKQFAINEKYKTWRIFMDSTLDHTTYDGFTGFCRLLSGRANQTKTKVDPINCENPKRFK